MTDRKQALADLIEKVEAGAFPADMCAFDLGLKGVEDINDVYEAFSGSLDAAKALHEAVLPGFAAALTTCGFRSEDDGKPGVLVLPIRPDGLVEDKDCFETLSDTPARAWLLAILKALHAQEGTR